jgi:hypothetical protein
MCIDQEDRGGVEVRIPSLGLMTVTDDSGNYSFQRVPATRHRVSFKRAGFFDLEANLWPQVDFDGRFRFYTVALHAHHNYSGDFDGAAAYEFKKIVAYKDTLIVGVDGELYKSKTRTDSVLTTTITFPVKALDGAGAPTTKAYPALYVSRQKIIDPMDTSTYLFAISEPFADSLKLTEQLSRKYGLKRSEPIFVAVSSYPSCMSEPAGGKCGPSWGVQAP